MTCSINPEELLARPVRMAFILFEATFARSPDECWWPEDSPEYLYWMECFGKKESPPAGEAGRRSIPHQRDVEMATSSTVQITA